MVERYSYPEISKIWTLENKFRQWLRVEIAAAEAMNKLGIIPNDDLRNIQQKADFRIEEIKTIEQKVDHDMIAFLTNVGEYVGKSSRYIHLGMTSSDVIDTANSCLMKEAGELILEKLLALMEQLKETALKYKKILCIGRSHGIHAEPTTFGLKVALWYDEMNRNLIRLKSAIDSVSVGQISGAVGNYAHLSPKIEEYVCKKLGLRSVNIANQIIQRDRYAEFMTTLAIIGSTIEKIATETRSLQRTEIHEVEEGFKKGQKGSSAMPHKKNPIIGERLCGMARILRGNSITALENNALWHERDISHSSTERIILPDSTILLYYMLVKSKSLIKNLVVFPRKMMENIKMTNGLIFSQSILLELARRGISREKAYGIVQENAMKCWETKEPFEELLKNDERLTELIKPDELTEILNLNKFLKNVDFIFNRVFEKNQ
ncbi:MAG: adenylosuccinate lyase [Candidatus Cloacimonadota bacterium]|nr:adenylosuccinate lyase [Candidatus Cloacimonadota bacterium]